MKLWMGVEELKRSEIDVKGRDFRGSTFRAVSQKEPSANSIGKFAVTEKAASALPKFSGPTMKISAAFSGNNKANIVV
jgi:hypothetical protein